MEPDCQRLKDWAAGPGYFIGILRIKCCVPGDVKGYAFGPFRIGMRSVGIPESNLGQRRSRKSSPYHCGELEYLRQYRKWKTIYKRRLIC